MDIEHIQHHCEVCGDELTQSEVRESEDKLPGDRMRCGFHLQEFEAEQ